jgi:heptaprenyl diphosphate synthase
MKIPDREIAERGHVRTLTSTAHDHHIAWLTALAIAIHIAESALPSPIPGLKPGLANVVTIAALVVYGWGTAAWVSLLRVLIGSILVGTFLTPTFMLSLSGAVSSVIVLGLLSRIPGRGCGPIGFSLAAALAHMVAQFYCAYVLFIPHEAIFGLLPVLTTMAAAFGLLNGLLVHTMLSRSSLPLRHDYRT